MIVEETPDLAGGGGDLILMVEPSAQWCLKVEILFPSQLSARTSC